MDGSLVEALEKRARSMLPPASAMAVECAADGGDKACAALLAHIVDCGLRGKDLCAEPYETVVFGDRVLLRCGGCPRKRSLPGRAGTGYGQTEAEARRNALYALTLPADKPARSWGEGPVRAEETACVFNRAAYASVEAL